MVSSVGSAALSNGANVADTNRSRNASANVSRGEFAKLVRNQEELSSKVGTLETKVAKLQGQLNGIHIRIATRRAVDVENTREVFCGPTGGW